MSSPTSTIDFQQSEASALSPLHGAEFRRSPSPFGRAQSPLRSRPPDHGDTWPSPGTSGDLSQFVKQLRGQVKQLQQDHNAEMDNVAQLRRRLNESEKEKLELTSAFNSENSELQAQVARLRAEVEKGEAQRQNIEYELALARNSASREKIGSSEKEEQLKGIITSQSEKLSSLSGQLQSLQSQASLQEREMVQLRNKHQRQLDEKEKQIASILAERDVLQTAKDEIEQVFHEQESLYADAQEKISELRIERDTQTQTVRQKLQDLQLSAEREEAAKREITAAKEEIRELQERIEKERAAHTESKFNFEIVQCQKRDLEGALSVEKSAREQAVYNIEALNKQIRELESAYQEEKREHALAKERLKRVNEENAATKDLLSAEMEQKREVLTGTTHQIELYQRNFNGLKEELSKAKKRQIYLEETYGGCMRELELLLTNFHVLGEGNIRPKRKTKGKGKKRAGDEASGAGSTGGALDLSPSAVLETLRHTLTDYQRRLDETSQELRRMSTLHEKLANECEHYREVTITRDHMVKDLQGKLSKTVQELEKVRGQVGEKETALSRLTVRLQKSEQGQESEKSKADNMAGEFLRQLSILEDEQERRSLYLHSIYQRLLAGRVVMQEQQLDKEGAPGFSWQELSVAVQEEVTQLMSSLSRAAEKVTALESELRAKKEQLFKVEEHHRAALEKLAQTGQQREADWGRQKTEIEHRFHKKMEDLHVKSKKSKLLAEEAMSKARNDGTARQELETQVNQLTATLVDVRSENTSLLTACALLSGALLPAYARIGRLAAQRHVLEQRIHSMDSFKRQARELVQTLSMENGSTGAPRGSGRARRGLLLRFRVAAIAVIAAHRLLYFAAQTDLLFTASESTNGTFAVPICLGNAHMPHRSFSGMNSIASTRSLLEAQTASWLTSPDLQTRILASMADLQQVLGQTGPSGGPSSYVLRQSVASAFENLLSRLAPCFVPTSSLAPSAPPSYPPYRRAVYMERGPLVRCLGHGLNRLLAHTSVTGVKNQYLSTEETMATLQNQMVDFMARLHEAEVERRALRKEAGKLRQEAGHLRLSSGIVSDLQQEIATLQGKVQDTVGKEKFDSICQELQQALQREQEAQRLLEEQSRRLEDLGLQLNVKTTEELEKDHNITEAIKGLSEAKMELRRKEQSVRQLSRQLSQLESERRSLQEGMHAAESALKSSTRDRESLLGHLRAVQSTIANAKHQIIARADSQTIDAALSKVEAPLLASSVSTPDMVALHNLVSTFVESQKSVVSRLAGLEREIESHKQHIARLKEELSDACNRQMAEGEVTPAMNGYGRSLPPYGDRDRSIGRFKPLFETEQSYKDVFVPLREVSDHSMQMMSTPAMARQDFLAGAGMATPAGFSSLQTSPIKQPKGTS
ncbi:coiled-coil domain-containing protein 171-like [Diadema setosum]|uniref:coiled-coil domain-containing protein 171-like n=1 Tax=Diadema setosum TaxID=31175 RepID=UPI003B3A944F